MILDSLLGLHHNCFINCSNDLYCYQLSFGWRWTSFIAMPTTSDKEINIWIGKRGIQHGLGKRRPRKTIRKEDGQFFHVIVLKLNYYLILLCCSVVYLGITLKKIVTWMPIKKLSTRATQNLYRSRYGL